MHTFFKQRAAVLVLAALLIVLIVFLPRKARHAHPHADESGTHTFSYETYYQELFSALSENNKQVVRNLEEAIEQASSDSLKASLTDSLAYIWRLFNRPVVAAHLYEQSAQITGNNDAWFRAGDAFVASFRFVEEDKAYFIEKALFAYRQILAADSLNLAAQTAIGVCYVEGGSYVGKSPMDGIKLLQEVLEKDPGNINALVNMGYFALQSGQMEKAKERFLQILQIDSTFAEAYIYLADIFLSTQDTGQAISALKEYKRLTPDEQLKEQVENYIEELRKTNI